MLTFMYTKDSKSVISWVHYNTASNNSSHNYNHDMTQRVDMLRDSAVRDLEILGPPNKPITNQTAQKSVYRSSK